MLLGDLMSRHVSACAPDDTLEQVARILWDRDVGVVPVVGGGKLVGMITDRDVCMAAYLQGRPLRDLRVAGVMAAVVHGLHVEDTVEDAMRVMRERQLRRVPITDDEGRLLGLVSLADLVRCAHVRDIADTLAAISRPRTEVASLTDVVPAGAAVHVEVRAPRRLASVAS